MNIIFDLGGVVFNWDPDRVARQCFPDTVERQRVLQYFMRHPEWIELDRGMVDENVILQNASERSGLSMESIQALWQALPRSLSPKEDTLKIIRRVKERGHPLYILSNMPHSPMDYLVKTYDFFKLFDGMVASCRVGKIKPDRDIYEHILGEYDLDPGETAFIDDLPENLEIPSAMGLRTILFTSAAKLEKTLMDWGCL